MVALVGRERPAATLKAEVDRTLRSHGGLVFVTGEAGIGKTTLVGDVAALAGGQGVLVASGTCWDREGAPGYWPWVQVLRTLQQVADDAVWADAREAAGSELAPLLGEPGTRAASAVGHVDGDSFGLHDAVTTLLVRISHHTPLVVVLDDLHWADPASVRLLEFVARHSWFEQLLVVGTYRDVEVETADHPLASVLLPMVAKATTVTLTGLDREEVGVLLTETAGRQPSEEMVAEVHHRTGGNPFFVDQTARLWSTGQSVDVIAPGVRDAVERRLGTLPEAVSEVLTAASVLGPETHPDVLAAVLGIRHRELSSHLAVAASARLMVLRDDGRVAFVHDIVRETLYGRLDEADARRRHAAVLRVFERMPELRWHSDAADMAHHGFLAVPEVPSREAVELLRTAADDAWGRLALDEARSHLVRAHGLVSDEDPELRGKVVLELGSAQEHLGEMEACRRTFEDVADLARRLGNDQLLARAALKLRGAVWLVATPESARSARELIDEAYAALVDDEDPAGKTDLERERALTSRAIELARASGDDEALVDALMARYDAIWEPGTVAERAAIAREISSVSRRRGDRGAALFSTMLRAMDLFEQGDPRCLEEHQSFAAVARSMSSPFSAMAAAWSEAHVAALEGRFADARAFLDESEQLNLQRRHGNEGLDDMAALFFQERWAVALQLGDLEAADKLVSATNAQAHHVEGSHLLVGTRQDARDVGDGDRDLWSLSATNAGAHPHIELLQAVTDVERGELDSARRYYGKVVAGEPLARWFQPLWLRFQAQVAAASGDPALVERARAALAPLAGQWLVMFCATTDGPVVFWLAQLDAAEQRWDEAVDGFTAAADAAQRLGARPWVLRAQLHLAEALLGRGATNDIDCAASLVDEVERGAAQLGMRRIADRTAQLGVPVPPTGVSQTDSGVVGHVFRFEGQVWTLGFAGQTVHMPDAKGLRDLHVLLGQPGTDVAAADLLDPEGGEAVRAAHKMGGDPVLDEKAKAAYHKRLTQLDDEIDRATSRGHDRKAAALDEERAALIEEIRQATGLGGRSRRLGDESERARKAVSERIRDSLRRLDQRHPQLAEHLRASVSTGARCGYHPDQHVSWSL